jgi:hypothetical protein
MPPADARGTAEVIMIKCKFNCGYYRKDLDLLICRPNGKLTADQMNDIAICRECIHKSGLLQVNRFHDLSAITSVDLGFADVQRICHVESQLRRSSSPIKACYWVPNALLYGTIRMYEALIESSGVEVHVSYAIADLAKILDIDQSQLTAEPKTDRGLEIL